MHLTEEYRQRLLHGELRDPIIRDHATDCPECRKLVADAELEENEIMGLLATVDAEPPDLDPAVLASLAQSRRKPSSVARYRWAAIILLGSVVAGVAYAAPGSPLKRWVQGIIVSLGDPTNPPVEAPVTGGRSDPGSGLAVDPGEALAIVFLDPPRRAQARVTFTEGTLIVVQAPSGQATFTSEADRLLVAVMQDSTIVEIQIPRAAPRVEILVGPRRLLLKSGTRIDAPLAAGRDSTYLLPLAP